MLQPPACTPGLGRRFRERPVAVVPEEEVRAEVRDVEVELAVVVVVAGADPVAPGRGVDSRLLRHVLELQAPEVAVEGVPVRHPLALVGQLLGGHEVDVELAVTVVVDESDAAAARFEDVVLRRAAAVGLGREAGDLGELHRRLRLRRVHGRRNLGGRRTHGGGVAPDRGLRHLGLRVAALEVQAEERLSLEARTRAVEQLLRGLGRERLAFGDGQGRGRPAQLLAKGLRKDRRAVCGRRKRPARRPAARGEGGGRRGAAPLGGSETGSGCPPQRAPPLPDGVRSVGLGGAPRPRQPAGDAERG